jgi:hypothetical protein
MEANGVEALIIGDVRRNKKEVSRLSPVQAVRHPPNRLKKTTPFELMGRRVSKASWMQVSVVASDWYFDSFLFAATSATPSRCDDASVRSDSAKVSVTGTS